MAPFSVSSARPKVRNQITPRPFNLSQSSVYITRRPICPIYKLERYGITGVSSFDISLEKQEVIVKGTAPYETVLEKIKKTGKEVRRAPICYILMVHRADFWILCPLPCLGTIWNYRNRNRNSSRLVRYGGWEGSGLSRVLASLIVSHPCQTIAKTTQSVL